MKLRNELLTTILCRKSIYVIKKCRIFGRIQSYFLINTCVCKENMIKYIIDYILR